MAKKNSIEMIEKSKYLELEAQVSNMELILERVNALADMGIDLFDEVCGKSGKAEALFYSIHLITEIELFRQSRVL